MQGFAKDTTLETEYAVRLRHAYSFSRLSARKSYLVKWRVLCASLVAVAWLLHMVRS